METEEKLFYASLLFGALFVVFSLLLFVDYQQSLREYEDELVSVNNDIESLEDERDALVIKIESQGEMIHFDLSKTPIQLKKINLEDRLEIARQYIKSLERDITRLDIMVANIERGT